jgi:Demethylmenaquinone methyltransferase
MFLRGIAFPRMRHGPEMASDLAIVESIEHNGCQSPCPCHLGITSVDRPYELDLPGDIIVADGDGVIAVPRSVANAVLDRALVRSHKEQQFRAEIVAGARLAALVGVDDQLDRLEIKRIKGRWEPKQQP